jgi:hypothetical protein
MSEGINKQLAVAGREGKAGYWVTVSEGSGPDELTVTAHISKQPANWPGISGIMKVSSAGEGIAMATTAIEEELERQYQYTKSETSEVTTLTYAVPREDDKTPQNVADHTLQLMTVGFESARTLGGRF